MDEKFLHEIVYQFRLNSNRISSLKREDVDKAVFIQQSALIRQYFPYVSARNELIESLVIGDFQTFKLQSIYL